MSGIEPIFFGLSLTQLLPIIIALSTITTLIIGVFKFLMKHVTKEAHAVRKEMTDKLQMNQNSLEANTNRVVDRQKEIQGMIGILNERITEIKDDVNNTVVEVKREIVHIDEAVNKRLDFKRAEIQKIQNEIDGLRHELQRLEVDQARREGLVHERMQMSEDRLAKADNRARISESKSRMAEHRLKVHDRRSDIADKRADISEDRADISEDRADISEDRADISEDRADVSEHRADESEETMHTHKRRSDNGGLPHGEYDEHENEEAHKEEGSQ